MRSGRYDRPVLNMKATYIASACVIAEHNGIQVLMDPWLTDGVYYGSWFHFPPLKYTPEDFNDVDYIYISHIHPDHLDVAALKRMDKSIPILIHDFAEKFLLNLLKKLGFETIHEIAHQQVFPLGPDFTLQILAADNCDPTLCGRYFNCNIEQPYTKTQQIDTLALFEGGNEVLVNCNDCPYELAKAVCDEIVTAHPQIDFLLVGYRGAGPYPQCFDNLDHCAKEQQALVHRDKMLKQSIDFIAHLQPKAFLPFAGQYTLGGFLVPLNKYLLPNLEELPVLFSELLAKAKLSSQLILLDSGAFYDLSTCKPSAPFTAPDPDAREKYIETVLTHKKFDYEADPYPDPDISAKLELALQRLQAHQRHFGDYQTNWNVYLDIDHEHLYQIPFNYEKEIRKIPPQERQVPYLSIHVDPRLMNRILERKAHWNNAEIGSHLRYDRSPNEFQRTIHFLLSYLQC